jgi:hypothetical protein
MRRFALITLSRATSITERREKTVKRPQWFALLAVAASLLSVPAALADQPTRSPLPATPFQFSADVCGFPIDFVPLQNKEFGKVFSNGIFAINGVFKAQYTNVVNEKTITLNISGPLKLTPQPDGTTLVIGTGGQAIFFFPGQLGPSSPGAFFLTHGRFSELVDENGPIPGTFTTKGRLESICAMLS